MNLETDNALLLTLMISQSKWSRELITQESKGSIVSWNRMCTKVIAATRASLKRANKAADLIRTGTEILDFYTWCIWIFNHNALVFTMIPCAETSQWHLFVSNIIMLSMFCNGSSCQRKHGLCHQTAEWYSNAESIFRHCTPDPAELNVDFNFIWTS